MTDEQVEYSIRLMNLISVPGTSLIIIIREGKNKRLQNKAGSFCKVETYMEL